MTRIVLLGLGKYVTNLEELFQVHHLVFLPTRTFFLLHFLHSYPQLSYPRGCSRHRLLSFVWRDSLPNASLSLAREACGKGSSRPNS